MNKDMINAQSTHDSYWQNFSGVWLDLDNSPRIQIACQWLCRLNPQVVLDIGCGPGHLGRLLKGKFTKIRVDGLDFSRVALDEAKKHLDNCWQVDIDQNNIPAADNTYDALCCLEMIEHVYDVSHLLQEIKRVLKNSGRALISVPNLAYWRYRLQVVFGILPHPEITDEKHLHFFTYASLRKRIKDAGMAVVECRGYSERAMIAARLWPALFSSTLFLEIKISQNG
jgi:2-polyprenyl-3-methyl-5-hydroxy-6-metoxy-1,4-benzoquinol methylase